MARAAKKETALTAEEKLAQALVPEAEQPYQVERNWCWSKFSSVIELISGRDAALSDCNDEGIGIPYILGASNLDNNSFAVERWIEKPQVVAEKGDILLSVKGTIGKLYIQQEDKINLSRQIMAIRSSSVVNKHYVYMFLTSICEELREEGSGLIPGISRQDILNRAFPLPPLAEQQRIVDRIESLFAKLDEAKEKAQAVVDGFEDRKAAILHKAFTGELTAEWRKRNSVSIKEWRKKNLGAFSFVTKLAGFEYTKNIAPNLVESGIPLFKGKNVQQGKLVLEFESFIPKEVSDELPRSQLKKKCLLTPYVGTIGNIAIFDGSFEAHLGSNVGKIEIESETFEEFLLYYLRSDLGYKELTKAKKATAQESISIQAIRNVEVLLPTLAEQQEIVSILDRFIGQEEQAKETAEQVIDQIDIMKKAILARAFRGELGTNDPTDESAEELLKRVL